MYPWQTLVSTAYRLITAPDQGITVATVLRKGGPSVQLQLLLKIGPFLTAVEDSGVENARGSATAHPIIVRCSIFAIDFAGAA
jgi:hypothetical protein